MTKASQNRVRAWTWTLGSFCAIFIGSQFIRPELNNQPTTAELNAPPEVKQILQNSCYSCHSNQTRLPWFDEIAPAYWLVASDVKQARKHLNFSEIAKLPAAQQKGVLFEVVNQIQLGAMPLPAYRFVHRGSVVTPEQLDVLKQYLHPPVPNKPAAAADVSAADRECKNWAEAGGGPGDVRCRGGVRSAAIDSSISHEEALR
jgi:hypothetical protein